MRLGAGGQQRRELLHADWLSRRLVNRPFPREDLRAHVKRQRRMTRNVSAVWRDTAVQYGAIRQSCIIRIHHADEHASP
eukprot:29017-Pleurochrysis_carterae.AAC.1